jgi:hypothetical protein
MLQKGAVPKTRDRQKQGTVYRTQPDLSAHDSFIFIEISAKDLPNYIKFL